MMPRTSAGEDVFLLDRSQSSKITTPFVYFESVTTSDSSSTRSGTSAIAAQRRAGRTKPASILSASVGAEIGRAHVCTPVTNAHLVCRLLHAKTNNTNTNITNTHKYA